MASRRSPDARGRAVHLGAVALLIGIAGALAAAAAGQSPAQPPTFRSRADRLRDTLKYDVLVVDEKKARVRSLAGLEAQFVLGPAAVDGSTPAEVTYQVSDAVDLAPGRYQLRVSATSSRLDRGGSVYLDVDVPDFAAAPLAVSGLVVGYADGARVPVARAAPRQTAPASARPLPFAPSLDRRFAPGDVLRVYFEVAAHDAQARPQVTLDLIDAAGDLVSSAAPSVEDGWVEVAIPLTGLAPGAYILRAAASLGREVASQQVGLVVY